jgi:hypothetical protein
VAELVSRAIDKKYDGVPFRASKASRIPAYEFTRIKQKTEARLTLKYVKALERLVLPEDRRAFRAALIYPDTLRRIRNYDAWLNQQAKRSMGDAGWRYLSDPGMAWRRSDQKAAQIDRIAEAIRIGRRGTRVMGINPLVQLTASVPRELLGEPGTRKRAWLAWSRIIAPLLDAAESDFVEPDAGRLTDAEFAEFLWHGIAREQILMDAFYPPPPIPGVPAPPHGQRHPIRPSD